KRVEGRNFGIRKHLLEYDDVMNQQRTIIYDRRNYALKDGDLKREIFDILEDWVDTLLKTFTDSKMMPEEWDWDNLRSELASTLGIDISLDELSDASISALKREIVDRAIKYYDRKEKFVGEEQLRFLEKFVTLRTIDEKWRDHLYSMDQLKEGINWRAYGQKDPLLEYKGEGFDAFVHMIEDVNKQTLKLCFRAQIGPQNPEDFQQRRPRPFKTEHKDSLGMGLTAPVSQEQGFTEGTAISNNRQQKRRPVHIEQKVGRNDPCPCGSGKKYKKCCGAIS
ncbi:MAG: SEC-C domain-containing protein, partial [Candidatus Marinimicrobia bacterium]|nr:SEC-C domain-containing protein [Candidatus Neomarinimicrobiota bacterium]